METVKDIVASAVGSAACVYTGQPFDTVKVRMQVQPGEFKNSLECFRKTFSGEGIVSFWRGSLPAVIGALSENAVAFAANGALKRFISKDSSSQHQVKVSKYFEPFLIGGFTGACTAFVLCPCDVVKCRAQINRSSGLSSSVRDVISAIIRKNGYGGLYRGIHAQVLRDIPFYAAFFGTYDILCQHLKSTTKWTDVSVYFISGGIAGQVAWLVSISPDVIKSRIQTADQPLTISQAARNIIDTRGIRGFFTGVEVAIIRAFPANAALFVGYELARKFMN